MKRNYDEAKVIRELSKKNTIKISAIDKTIKVDKSSSNVGNGSWGKIDYLCKVHGYIVMFVEHTYNKSKTDKFVEENDNTKVNSKMVKRETKLNMAAMTRSAMKKAKTK